MAQEVQSDGILSHYRNLYRRLYPNLWGNELVLVLAIGTVILLTGALDPQHTYFDLSFWDGHGWDSARDVLRFALKLGIFALGSAVVIISGGIDLSCGAMIAFGGTVCACTLLILDPETMLRAQDQDLPIWVIAAAIGAAVVAGLLVGSLHAWLITMVGLPPFIATLATLVGLRSLSRALIPKVTEAVGKFNSQISIFDPRFRELGKNLWIQAGIFAVLALAVWALMSRTIVGRHLYALGGNESAARLSGIRTDRLKWLAYCLSAVLAAIAGVLYIGEQSKCAPELLGLGYELNAIAAAVIGGCSLQGGVGTIPGTVLGCLFLRVVMDGIQKVIKVAAETYEGLIVGIVVVIAVAVNEWQHTTGAVRQFFPGILGAVTVLNLSLLTTAITFVFSKKETGFMPAIITGLVTLAALSIVKLLQDRAARRAAVPVQE